MRRYLDKVIGDTPRDYDPQSLPVGLVIAYVALADLIGVTREYVGRGGSSDLVGLVKDLSGQLHTASEVALNSQGRAS